MDPIPLIPKSNQIATTDTSHIIREVFQDIITASDCSKHIAENAERFNSENQNLKATGTRVTSAYNGSKLVMEDIGFVEDNMMINQGKFLKEHDVITKDEILTEMLRLKRKEVFSNIDLNNTRKYGLLQKFDLLPNKPETSMDFRINSNRHDCPTPCPREVDVSSRKNENRENCPKKHTLQIPSDLRVCMRQPVRNLRKDQDRPVIFIASPDTVIFKEYELGEIYVKRFKLRNISKTMQAFIPRFLPKPTFFKVELESGSTRVAPGVCAVFAVKYQTDIYQDVDEFMIFNTYTGQDIEVKLKSRRQPPNLTAFIFKSLEHFTEKFVPLDGLNFHDKGRAIALNSTIDCGSCLLGNQLKFNLILKNDGTVGKFFLLSEDDWCVADISDTNKELEMMSPAFHIYPTYFEIDTNDFVELDVTFNPLKFGLEVEKLFLLCDNNTLEELEIVGDGVLFEQNSVIIQLDSKNENMLNMDAKSSYLLNFGKCIPYQKVISRFNIYNNSIVDLKYKWEIRESVCHREGATLKKLNCDWIQLQELLNYLPAQTTSEFQLKLECNTDKTGCYSLVFTLHVLDIPEASLVENNTFNAIEVSSTSITDEVKPKYLNIIVGEIEVMCEIVPIHIQLDPANIELPYKMDYEEVFKQKVQIYTTGPSQLNCEWIAPITNTIKIYPMEFSINPECTFICDIVIFTDTYQDVNEKLLLRVNDGLHEKELNITATVFKPIARFSENLLNFGYIPKNKKVPGKRFQIENFGEERIYWEIFEFYFDHEHNTIIELDASKHITVTCGELRSNEVYDLVYEIDNYDQHHRWLSFLILLSSHPTMEAMDSLCLITYEITQPEVIIHTSSSQQPILYPGKLLYVGVSTTYMVCLHNIGTKLAASFIWGKPVGERAEDINIICSPKSGIIKPEKCAHITITLMAMEAGIYDEVYVPCFIGNMDEPIMLTVLCAVDNISLYLHIPDEEGRLIRVFWPPKIISDFEGFSLDLDNFETGMEENTPIICGCKKYHRSYRSCMDDDARQGETEAIKNLSLEILQPEEEPNYEFQLSLESSESSIDVGRSASSSLICPSPPLKDCFGSDLILQDNILEYRNVPLRTPVKKSIILENVTPIPGNFIISTINFTELDNEQKGKDVMDNILVKLKIKKRDEWEERINGDNGIVVKPMPEKGTVLLEKSIEIDIWVYSNTWGTYIEEILVEINDIMPFCFNLLIEVVGIPIEFPIALNSINNEPTLRFGNIPYLSKPIKRNLKVSNNGCVPITLEWFVFIRKNSTASLTLEKDSFDDVCGSFYQSAVTNSKTDQEITFKSVIAPGFGVEDNSIFKIEPRSININSKSTQTVTITITIDYFKPKFTITEIEAYLYGFVRLPEEFTFQSNLFSRQTDINAPPAKVKLLANLELPLLKLELVKGDVRINTYANDIIEAEEIIYQKVLVFKNVDTAPAMVYMHTLPPFYVISLKTAQTNTDKKVLAAVVQPGECVEVLVECKIDGDEVLQYSDMLFNENATNFLEIPDFKNCSIILRRYLNIHQLGFVKQITALELVVFYPELQISDKLIDFGIVFIGNSKKMILTLKNPTGSRLPFTIHKPTTSSAVIITPSTGIIPKANGTTPSTIIISLFFIPSECRVYQESIRILSNIPFHSFTVNLVGAGTNNEKFYVEGM